MKKQPKRKKQSKKYGKLNKIPPAVLLEAHENSKEMRESYEIGDEIAKAIPDNIKKALAENSEFKKIGPTAGRILLGTIFKSFFPGATFTVVKDE